MSSRLFKHQMASNNRPPRLSQVAVSYGYAPWAAFYNLGSNDTLSPLPTPPEVSSICYAIDYTQDGKFMAAALNGQPYVGLYRRQGGSFVPATLTPQPNRTPSSLKFSPSGEYLFVTHASFGGDFDVYKRNADGAGYTKLTTGVPVTSDNCQTVSIDPTDTYVAVAYTTAVFRVYKRVGDTFTQVIEKPANAATQAHNGFAWSLDGKFLFAGISSSSINMVVYALNNDVVTRVTDTSGMTGTGAARSVAVSPDGQHIAICGSVGGYVAFYKFNGTTLTKLNITLANIAGAVNMVAYSPDGKYFAATFRNTTLGSANYTVYKRVGDAYTPIPSLGPYINIADVVARCITFGPAAN